MARVLLLGIVVFALVTAQPAVAQDETWVVYPTATVPDWAVKMSLRIATREWSVCQGTAAVEWIYSTELTGEAGHAWPGNCQVSINTGSYPVHGVGPFCDTVVHEYGHVADFTDPLNTSDPHHSHDPSSIMAASSLYVQSNGKWTGVHPMCRPVVRRATREAREARKARKACPHHARRQLCAAYKAGEFVGRGGSVL